MDFLPHFLIIDEQIGWKWFNSSIIWTWQECYLFLFLKVKQTMHIVGEEGTDKYLHATLLPSTPLFVKHS